MEELAAGEAFFFENHRAGVVIKTCALVAREMTAALRAIVACNSKWPGFRRFAGTTGVYDMRAIRDRATFARKKERHSSRACESTTSMGTATAAACQQRASQCAPIIHRAAMTERELEMHRWIAAISSALLIPGLTTAATAAATPFINFSKDTPDDRIEAAGSFSINLYAGSFTLINNVSPRVEPVAEVLLSRSQPKDIDNSDIQFPVSADEFASWPGEDWLP